MKKNGEILVMGKNNAENFVIGINEEKLIEKKNGENQ